MPTLARSFFVGLVAVASLALLEPRTPADPASARIAPRTVYLGGKLSDEALISFGAAVATQPASVLLLDSPALSPYLRQFLQAYKPQRIVPVGDFPEGHKALADRLGVAVEPIQPWSSSQHICPLWNGELPRSDTIVLCPARPRALLLRAALLAACEGAPLWIGPDDASGSAALAKDLQKLRVRRAIVVGKKRSLPSGLRVVHLPRPAEVDAACRATLADDGRIETAVVINPRDHVKGLGGMSVLAPWLAATRRATLVCTNETGSDIVARVEAVCRHRTLAGLDSLILLANLKAIPMWQRPNPIPADKDQAIDLEPFTPADSSPVSYAIGRLFHEDRAAVPLMLARQRLLAESTAPRRALVASNPGGGLGLLETFSRNTAQELRNAGYDVTGLFGKEVNAEVLRAQMPKHEIFLWEGHHNTLVKEWGFTTWDEPLPPSFVFLQSCLALMPEKVHPLLSRGALGVVGTSTRTYSGSGGAFSLAYFNSLLYDGQSLGGSLRQAKNFLIAYATFKEKRLGPAASRIGANQRAVWAFTLWGDPTYRLPRPARPATARSNVQHRVIGEEIRIELPGSLHDRVRSDRYQVRMPPNGRLAGLIRRTGEESNLPVVPLVFAEVHLPDAKPNVIPKLKTRLPETNWVFLWDARRRTGYVLAAPRTTERSALRFRVTYGSSVVSSQ